MQNPATVPNLDTGDMRDRLVWAGADEMVTKADIALLRKAIDGKMAATQAEISTSLATTHYDLCGKMDKISANVSLQMSSAIFAVKIYFTVLILGTLLMMVGLGLVVLRDVALVY